MPALRLLQAAASTSLLGPNGHTSLQTLVGVTVTNPFNGWPVQLAVAAPFALGLAFLGKWLISRLEKSEDEKKSLYERIISDSLTAINASTAAIQANTSALSDSVNVVRDVKQELYVERQLRIRYEERLKIQDESGQRG